MLVLAARSANAQDPASFGGTYTLTGISSDGRPVAATLKVETDAKGNLSVSREGQPTRGGLPLDDASWTADGTISEPNVLTVRFEHTLVTPGISGRLGGETGNQTETIEATYTFSPDGLRVSEAVARPQAPGNAWNKIASQGARDLSGLTYGQVAGTVIPRMFDQVASQLGTITKKVMPTDVQQLRYSIAELRDLVDVFAYAYPTDGDKDTWKKVRDDLDEGYESLGNFKDLYDAQGAPGADKAKYDPAKLAELRQKVLDWKNHFDQDERLDAYREYLASPKKNKITERKKGDLSSHYWGDAGIEPDKSLSGVENLAKLEGVLLGNANDELEKTTELRKLHKDQAQEDFHSFRKQFRATTKLAGYFPQLFTDQDPKANLPLLIQAVDRYGDVHDKIVAYDLATEKGDDKTADGLIDQISQDWKSLRGWQRDAGVSKAILDRRSALVGEDGER